MYRYGQDSPFYSIILLCIVDSEIEEESEEDEDYIPSEDWKKVFFQNLQYLKSKKYFVINHLY